MKKIISLILTFIMLFAVVTVAVPSAFAAGDFSTARSINTNQLYSGNISEAEDRDFYKFTLSSAGSVNLSFAHKNLFSTEEYWYAVIYTSSTNYVCSFSFYGTDESVDTYKVGLNKGTYYLRITGGDYSDYYNRCDRWNNASYTFSINYSSSAYWEKENNNGSMTAAPSIKLNSKYYGTICQRDDNDFYKFTLSQAGVIRPVLKHAKIYDTQDYFNISIYDSNTNLIFSGKDSGVNKSTQFATIGLNKGTYYLRITGGDYSDYYNRCDRYSQITYNFNLNYSTTNYSEKENNDGFVSATSLSLGNAFVGSVNDSKDNDYYRLKLTKAMQVKFTLSHANVKNSEECWVMWLYDNNTNEITHQSVSGTKTGSMTLNLKKGTYYIRVTGGSYSDYWNQSDRYYTNDYKLTANRIISVAKPTSFKASGITTTSAKLSWSKVSGAAGYVVYKYTASSGKYTKIASTTSTSYTVKSLKAGTKYKYAIKAYKTVDSKNYYSGYTSLLTVNTKCTAPSISKITSPSSNKATVSWGKVSGASKYIIYKSTNNSSWTKAATTAKTSCTLSNLSGGRKIYVKVVAVNASSLNSSASAVKSVTVKR